MKWNIFYWTFAKGVNLTYLWEEVRGESTHHMVCCLDVHHQAVWAQQHRTTLNKVRKLSQVGVIRHNWTSRQNEFFTFTQITELLLLLIITENISRLTSQSVLTVLRPERRGETESSTWQMTMSDTEHRHLALRSSDNRHWWRHLTSHISNLLFSSTGQEAITVRREVISAE